MIKRFYVYALIDPRRGKKNRVFYIGKGTWSSKRKWNERNQAHLRKSINGNHYNPYLQNTIKKIIAEGLVYGVEFLFSTDNEDECLDVEIYWIAFYGRKTLCNLTDGGEGCSGRECSAETKAKIGKANGFRNRNPSEETKNKRRRQGEKHWNFGNKMTPEKRPDLFVRGTNINSTSGYKGVFLDTTKNRWLAQIMVKRRSINLGRYIDIRDAVLAYNAAAIKYFGAFAYRNPVPESSRLIQKPRVVREVKTHCPKGHPYDEENTYIYNGYRHCRKCRRSGPRAIATHCPKGHLYDEDNTYLYKGRKWCRECRRVKTREFYRNKRRQERLNCNHTTA